MTNDIDFVTREVCSRVTAGRPVTPHEPVRVPARELTIEFDPAPYPEVPAAFTEFCRVTATGGRLSSYEVRPVGNGSHGGARVTAIVRVADRPYVGDGVGDDVVTASVRAFAAALARAA